MQIEKRLDELGITPQCMDQLRSALPDVAFVRCFGLLERVRSIKTPDEIARLAVRRDERCHHGDAVRGQPARHVPRPAQMLLALGPGEAGVGNHLP